MSKCKHIWKKTTFKRYDAVGGEHHFKCKKCGKKKKEWVTEYL